MDYLWQLKSIQDNWTGYPLDKWMATHTEVPVFAVCIYLGIIFQVPKWLENSKPFALRVPFAIWNFLLATFSILGSIYTVPHLATVIYEKGFFFSVCHDPDDDFYFQGPSGFWTAMFILSKIPELLDTVFLVLQKKPVIFLHWFHHTTVMLYCWDAFRNRMSNGLWFAAMNFFVHSIMYTYYFFMAINMKKLVKPIAPMITSLQLLQMVVGMTVTATAFYYHVPGDMSACHAVSSNIKMGLAMYVSYFVLFAMLFKKLYITKKGKKASSATPAAGKQLAGATAPITLEKVADNAAENADPEDDICAVAGVAVSKVDDYSPSSSAAKPKQA